MEQGTTLVKISVITINRNNAKGLAQTMETVFNQTRPPFEYIVIDGLSTDESVDVIKKQREKITYWISEKDIGVFNAMNKGIVQATGEYLLFLNSGDYFKTPTVLQEVAERGLTADIVYGRCDVSDKGRVIFTTDPPEFLTFLNFYGTTIAHQATFIKKSLFEKHGLYIEKFKLMGDWEFWIRTIILGGATARKTEVIIADYNLDGISGKKENESLIREEQREILNHPILKRFLPDYEQYRKEQEDMQPYYWLSGQKTVSKGVHLLYKFALWMKKK